MNKKKKTHSSNQETTPTTERIRIAKIGQIISKARLDSGMEDENVIGEAFNKLLDSSDELIDLLIKIMNKRE